jgi:hypothetical protein
LAAFAVGCTESPAIRVPVPTNDPKLAPPPQKPLPPEAVGFDPDAQKLLPGQLEPVEAAFVKAYQDRRSPRLIIMVNRSIHSAVSLPDGALEVLARDAGGEAGNSEYDAVETALVGYFSRSGRVAVSNSAAARKLDRAKVLRLENGDVDMFKQTQQELGADIFIRVATAPSDSGMRVTARATGMNDATYFGMAADDVPAPVTRTAINASAYRLSHKLMEQMARRFAGQDEPVEVRVLKAKSAGDTMLVQKFIQKTRGVTQVRTIVGADAAANAVMAVTFNGPAEDFLVALRENEQISKGIKISDLANNALSIEVEGNLDLKVQTMAPDLTTGKPALQSAPVTPDGN